MPFTGEKTHPHPRWHPARSVQCLMSSGGVTCRRYFLDVGIFVGDCLRKAISWPKTVYSRIQDPKERLYVSIYKNDDEAFAI